MTARLARWLRSASVLVFTLAWVVGGYLASAGYGGNEFKAVIAAIPLLLAVGIAIAQLKSTAMRLLAAAVVFTVFIWLIPELSANVALVYYLQHLGTHLALAVYFGRTLIGPGEALITRLARTISGGMISPEEANYTRGLTIAWTTFFIANGAISTLLFLFASLAVWSLHANLLTIPLVGLVFLGDIICHHIMLPNDKRPGLIAIVNAYRQHMRGV